MTQPRPSPRARAGLALALSCALAAPARGQTCGATAVVAPLGGANAGTFGPVNLSAPFLPVVGGPFELRAAGGVPGALGVLFLGPADAPVGFAEFASVFHPAPPLRATPFVLDGNGAATGLLAVAQLGPAQCGVELVAQAVAVDAGAPGGLAASNGLRVGVGDLPSLAVTLDPVVSPTAAPDTVLTGTGFQPGDVVRVESVAGTVETTVAPDSTFAVVAPLKPNAVNALYVREVLAGGGESAPVSVSVVHDGTPPDLFVDFPADGAKLPTPTTGVSGRVGDALSGFMGLEVEVNGAAAVVDVGIGTNGTFEAVGVPLVAGGPTAIDVVARDALGNEVTRRIEVEHEVPTGFALLSVAGDGQSATMKQVLADPLEVDVRHPDGSPFAGKLVTFRVTRSDGRLAAAPGGPESQLLQVFADGAGRARAWWRVGSDAGCGSNRVEVTSAGLAGTAYFCASAAAGVADRIHVASGADQRVAAGGPSLEPLRVWVSDGCNGVAGVPVVFSVVQGSASFVEDPGAGVPAGATVATVPTGPTGHAAVGLVLDSVPGANAVVADFPGNPGAPARFDAVGVGVTAGGATSFEGLVLDNSMQPIEGAAVDLVFDGQPPISTATDASGAFSLANLAFSGLAHLHVDGSTATSVGGAPVPVASLRFPALAFEPFVVAGAVNELPMPILLPRVDPTSEVLYDGTQDVVLSLDAVEGLEFEIAAGTQVTLADGTVAGPSAPVALAVHAVHTDEVPMPLPDGAAPAFTWTFQPGGATFDPPVRITYPNVNALPPGAVANLLSFDHDTARFEVVGTGAVLPDGSAVVSDPGSGLAISGWGGLCPPYPTTGEVERCRDLPLPGGSGASLSGDVEAQPEAVCLFNTVTFGVTDFEHVGGMVLRECELSTSLEQLPSKTPSFEWSILQPDTTVVQGTGPVAQVPADVPGKYTCEFELSVSDASGTTQVTLGQVEALVADLFWSPSPAMIAGFDDFSDVVPAKAVDRTQGDVVLFETDPQEALMHVDIESTDPSVVTVFPDEPLATVETVDLTGVGVGVALVRADVNDQDVFSCAPLEVHVFDPAIKSVAIVRVIEDNDDVQAIGVAQGLANQVSIQAAPAQPLATTPNGDDAVVPAGDAIHNGPDGVCQTTAVGTDVQVIPVAQGVPFVPVVLGGANGHLESSPGGDDTILGNDILAGLNGICETTANQTDVPAADLSVPLLANYLDFQVFDQAVVTWLATELPDLEVNWDLDNDGKFEIGGAEEQALVSAGIGAGFDQVVFLVPQIRDDLLLGDLIGVTTLGYTYLGTKFCFVDVANSDQLSDARQIVAHELGHANGSLQHKPNDPLNLMHPISGPAKTRLLRDQWHDLNP